MLVITPLITMLAFAATSVISTPVPAAPVEELSLLGPSLKTRDVTSIEGTITDIDTKLKTLNSSVSSFNPGIIQTIDALEIVAETESVQKTVEQGTDIVNESDQLNSTDSGTIAVAVLSLASDVYSSLDEIVAKKPAFDKAILGIASASSLVEALLVKLRSATKDYGDALTTKLDSSYQALAPTIVSSIDSAFATAIAAYS